ncbi:MAG: hypothetical protein LBR92_00330 [Puniceicoccales bacterium]|nr:hypothetical protein [Puniceicoccales bacterium]
MNEKVCRWGLLFSLSLCDGLEAEVLPEEENQEKPVQSVVPLPLGETRTSVSLPPMEESSSTSKVKSVNPLVTLEFSNIQKLFDNLKAFNKDENVANLILQSFFPEVGKNFSALAEDAKATIIFLEKWSVIIFKPTAENKKIFLNKCQDRGWPFWEQDNYFIVPMSQERDYLSLIPSDLIKRATTPVAKEEKLFKIEYALNVDEVGEIAKDKAGEMGDIISACYSKIKDFKGTVEFNPEGIKGSVVISAKSDAPFYAYLAKEKYAKPLPPLVFGQDINVQSYLICQDITWIFDVINSYVPNNFGNLTNSINNVKKCEAGMDLAVLSQYNNGLVYWEIGETTCKTAEEYVSCENSLLDIANEWTDLPGETKKEGTPSLTMSGNADQKSKTEDKADTKASPNSKKTVKLVCEHKGCSIYVTECDDKNESVEYLAVRDGLVFSSGSLDFLKSHIDVLVAGKIPTGNKTPTTTLETLVGECPPDVIFKGKSKIVPLIQFLNTEIAVLKKYFTDALLAKIGNNAEISFEIIAQGEGVVAFQFFVNNSCLQALSIFIEILNNMFVDFSHQPNGTYKGMIPIKTDEAKTQNFIPAKKDAAKENLSLVPIKVTYNWDVGSYRDEEPQILIPLKILTEYKAVG